MPYADKEKALQYHRDKYLRDPEKYIDYARQYRKTPKGRKVDRISRWVNALNMIVPDVDAMYVRYESANECELCETPFVKGKKCLDHDHISRYPRFVCCIKCNNKLASRDLKHRLMLLDLHRSFNLSK